MIDRQFLRLEGVWLPEKIESSSNIRFAGNLFGAFNWTESVSIGFTSLELVNTAISYNAAYVSIDVTAYCEARQVVNTANLWSGAGAWQAVDVSEGFHNYGISFWGNGGSGQGRGNVNAMVHI